MTTLEKNSLYDRVCLILTEYEESTANEYDLYDVLVDVANCWEELTE